MSRAVAALVYSRKCGSMARKAVLAYFAERANEDGSGIWASKQRIAAEIECTKQTVITTVKALQAAGLIHETGRHRVQGGYTVVYAIDLAAVRALEPAHCAENQSNSLTTSTAEPVKPLDPFTGQTVLPVKLLDPKESNSLTQTVLEPSLVDTNVSTAPLGFQDEPASTPEPEAEPEPEIAPDPEPHPFPRPDWADPEVWSDWMDVRKTKKGRNTATAHKGFLSDIARLVNDEWPPGRLLEYAVQKSWAGIYAPKEGYPHHDQNIRAGSGQQPDKRSGLAKALDAEISRNRSARGSLTVVGGNATTPGRG